MSGNDDLRGKAIVVTGASSGFGRGAAVALGERGAHVVLAARRGDVLDEVAAEISGAGGTALAVQTDVSDPEAVEHLAAAAEERFGPIDVWINNAAVGVMGLFWEVPLADHARLVDVDLKGMIYGAHVALQRFTSRGRGVLINVGSVAGEVPLAYQSTYSAVKAGITSLGRSLNEELRLAGLSDAIMVGTILPWAADTPWWDHVGNYTGHAPRMTAMDDPDLIVDAIVAACTNPEQEQPVGPKGRAAHASHRLFRELTERFSGKLSKAEIGNGAGVPDTAGAIHRPVAVGTAVRGGTRERMVEEDTDPRS
ncbi:SDR family NAD(P)-dependent oxidoreductase [Dietzia sp. SLG310A2-38A2]|uniref:SDR family NAD(P)-dependent oxidoreductase n=1 Tax=Dietzia sp. SLG310A2-38A2 TaxID=1630643 RepID=UPI0015FD04FE|nr:SDR family NAD(P)-dependent oxidoreductase [Dietzia sp. SLG310A2-38A2]MBB1031661.1 SDR family NAD(P)-dependent oxidoreductase [Dietzia sp. SLG310A2-38A2]